MNVETASVNSSLATSIADPMTTGIWMGSAVSGR